MSPSMKLLIGLAFFASSISLLVAGQGVSCDTSATSGDTAWRTAMHNEILDPNSEISVMIDAMCHPDHPAAQFYDCTANGNTRQNCKYSVTTLSYSATFGMWDSTSTYTLCDSVARLISGFCISSHPPRQGSGYYRSSSDNYNLELTANTPFITCSSDTITSGDTPSYTSTLLEAVCGVDACQYPEDTPECDRIARFDATFYVQLKAQNYGSGGTPHCSAAAGEIISRCVQDNGKAGGYWGIGGMAGASQEYVELKWVQEEYVPFSDVNYNGP